MDRRHELRAGLDAAQVGSQNAGFEFELWGSPAPETYFTYASPVGSAIQGLQGHGAIVQEHTTQYRLAAYTKLMGKLLDPFGGL